ncbi:MAG TPA: Gfo/Idh/MocA family oxidoreductase [Bacteroidales bacterium]|nr:Gfo/Idh/MocA family oxidoreductase [Bacteroidales bacterium]
MNTIGRRNFLKSSLAGAVTAGFAGKFDLAGIEQNNAKRIGIIGLDTSHSTAFTKALNSADAGQVYKGFRIAAAYPKGSSTIKSSADRIPGYTEEVKNLGVKIVGSVDELLAEVDFVLLETNDGRMHLEQALKVFRSGKRVFIDKPVAASLTDAIAIFEAAKHYNVPVFSSSSLRYITGMDEIAGGSIGKVLGADAYSPATLESTHPDLFWYGIHGVETLFTAMGRGCVSVTRTSTEKHDVATGLWNDGRIGTFRGIRDGKSGYGGQVFGEKGISVLGPYAGYDPLLKRILEFFESGIPPVSADETLEIFTFMAAADESKNNGGIPVKTADVFEKARKEAIKIDFDK